MTEEEAEQKIQQFLSDVQTEQSLFENRKLRIKSNPGFPMEIQQDRYSSAVTVRVGEIDNIHYLSTIPVYVSALFSLTQGTYKQSMRASEVKSLCRGKKEIQEVKIHDQELGAPASQALPAALVFETRDTARMDDILFGDYDDEEDGSEEEDEEYGEEDGIELGELLGDTPSLVEGQEEVQDHESGSDEDDESEDGGGEDDESDDDDIEFGDLIGGGPTPRNIIGTKLRNTNYFQKRLHDRDPKLFLETDSGKFNSYSRLCLSNLRRQPVILTDAEKREIDKNHRDAYTTSLTYGSSRGKQYHYICPRYWCMSEGVPLTYADVQAGECGGEVIDFKAEEITKDGGLIYEFRARQGEHDSKDPFVPSRRKNSKGKFTESLEAFAKRSKDAADESRAGNYHWHAPGFTKDDTHPEGKCIPCCFKIPKNKESEWMKPKSSQRKRMDECEATMDTDVPADTPRILSVKTTYVMGSEKMPLSNGRWGYLPIALQSFFQYDNRQCYLPEDPKVIKPGISCILRMGVESNPSQSFVACIANLYGGLMKTHISVSDMKEVIIGAVNMEEFLGYQNGNLLSEFAGPEVAAPRQPLAGVNMEVSSQREFHSNVVSAYTNFCAFIRSDGLIDYTYLWDVICRPNSRLFADGLNLVVLDIPDDDVTANVKLICPSNHYSVEKFVVGRPTFIVFRKSGFFEPIYVYDSGTNVATRLYEHPYKGLPRQIKHVLRAVKRIYARKCAPLPSVSPDVYRFRSNLPVTVSIDALQKSGYTIRDQVLNYNSKCIGVVASKKGSVGFVPVSPSGLLTDLPFQFIDSLDDVWRDYGTTVGFLNWSS